MRQQDLCRACALTLPAPGLSVTLWLLSYLGLYSHTQNTLLTTTGGESADTFMTPVMCCYVKIDISAGTGTGQLNGTHCVQCGAEHLFDAQGQQSAGLKHAAVLMSGSLPSAHWERRIWQSPVAIG